MAEASRSGRSWTGVGLSYHLYHAGQVIALLPWAAVSVWLYGRARLLVPLIMLHTGRDLLIGSRWFARSGGAWELTALFAALGLAGCLFLVATRHPGRLEPKVDS